MLARIVTIFEPFSPLNFSIDEIGSPQTEFVERADHQKTVWRLSLLACEGAEFVVTAPAEVHGKIDAMGIPSPERPANWARRAVDTARRLSEHLEAGPLSHIAGSGMERRLLVLPREDKSFLVGWAPETAEGQLLEKTKKLVASWES